MGIDTYFIFIILLLDIILTVVHFLKTYTIYTYSVVDLEMHCLYLPMREDLCFITFSSLVGETIFHCSNLFILPAASVIPLLYC